MNEEYYIDYIERDGKVIVQIWNNGFLELEYEGTEEQLKEIINEYS